MKINILRRSAPDAEPYWQSFDYEGSREISVAALLDHLDSVAWDCSCLQGLCGTCAMVINGVPALACETFLKDIRGDEISIRPLGKFPVLRDLIVDRSSIHENLKRGEVYIGEYKREYSSGKMRDHRHQYDAAKCLKCGLCLEVCPNYTGGESFFGALFANDCYLVNARDRSRVKDMHKSYAEHFGNTCSKSLSCMDVCPVKIQTIASMAKMNRTRFNAIMEQRERRRIRRRPAR